MVYNTREYWVFGLRPSSDILKNTTYRKLNFVRCNTLTSSKIILYIGVSGLVCSFDLRHLFHISFYILVPGLYMPFIIFIVNFPIISPTKIVISVAYKTQL
jgi:hypothetical protein